MLGMKRSISLLLCLLMCLSLFPTSAFAEELSDAEQMEEPVIVVEAEQPAEEPAAEAEETEPAEEPAAPEEAEPAAEEAESPEEATPVEEPAALPEEEILVEEELPAEEESFSETEDDVFVDEGFGSLDDHAINNALEALKDLSGSDKIIGIISHVKELQERIDNQIVISKDASGASRISYGL